MRGHRSPRGYILGHLVVSLRGVKVPRLAGKQSPKLRRLPRPDGLAMTTFSGIALVQNFEFIVKRTSILPIAMNSQPRKPCNYNLRSPDSTIMRSSFRL
jgi:hypothetical protein